MQELLIRTQSATIALFVAVSMFNVGLDVTIRQILAPLRDRALLTRALLANIVIVPVIAALLTKLIPIAEASQIGLLLYACCMGSEAMPKFVQIAKGDAAFAVALLGIMLTGTVIGVPFVLSLVLPEVHIDRLHLFMKLLAVVALPFCVGLFMRARRDTVAARASAVVHRVAFFLLLLAFGLVIYVQGEQFLALARGTLLAAFLFFALAFAIGYLSAGKDAAARRTLALMTCIRAGSVSMVIAGQVFSATPSVLVMATIMTALSVLVAVPTTFILRHRAAKCSAPAQAVREAFRQ